MSKSLPSSMICDHWVHFIQWTISRKEKNKMNLEADGRLCYRVSSGTDALFIDANRNVGMLDILIIDARGKGGKGCDHWGGGGLPRTIGVGEERGVEGRKFGKRKIDDEDDTCNETSLILL